MSDVRVQVDRARPTCPFCRDEVAGGLVWMCPGCDASHHAACHEEHGACASCALTEPREGVSAATKGEAPADDPGGLAPRRRELERLGFRIVRDTADELVALHANWRHDPALAYPAALRLPHAVFVRRVDHLTLARVKADLAALREDPLAARYTVPVYLADHVEPDARAFVESGQEASRHGGEVRFFPVIHDGRTGTGTYFARTLPLAFVGFVVFPGLRFLARRLLFPGLSPAATREPPLLTVNALALFCLVLTLVSLAVLLNAP